MVSEDLERRTTEVDIDVQNLDQINEEKAEGSESPDKTEDEKDLNDKTDLSEDA